MLLPRHVGTIVLAAWLILTGLSAFVNLGDLRKLLDLGAIIAGVLLLLSR